MNIRKLQDDKEVDCYQIYNATFYSMIKKIQKQYNGYNCTKTVWGQIAILTFDDASKTRIIISC